MKKVQVPKLELVCEECGFQTEYLEIQGYVFYCGECMEAVKRRARLKQADLEWEEIDKQNEVL